ncbi:Transcription elongation factor [Plasmodium coatneyi]|uniref:Transcription elongation factor n=1 Tax=Plasmodium coatneyi TaxID=208452 RepID=A0A1B1E080_9APIC|nr:Transcription elongation factor [Plasmodium coatneyi]ANQ08434.1 Transcription elongation factor [Plasmodium coatneyi]
MGEKEEGSRNGESDGKEQDGEDVVEPIQFVDVNSTNIFDLDITQLDIRRVNNHMKLSDISQLYYYLNKNSFCYTSEERPYISNMLELKYFFSSNEVENYEILEQLKQHDARENSRMRKFNLGRLVARSKLEEKEMMGMSGGKRGPHKVGSALSEYGGVTQVGRGDDDSEADVQTAGGSDSGGGSNHDSDSNHSSHNHCDSDDGVVPLRGARPNWRNNQTKRHHTVGEAWHTSVSSTNSCHSSESISSTSSYSFCSSTSSSSDSSSSSSSSLSAFSPNRTDKGRKKVNHMSNLKILDVIKKYNENLEKIKTKKKKKIKSRIGKLKKYDTVSIQGHNNKMVMSQIYKIVRKKSSVSIIGQLIYSSSDCKKFLYNNIDCHMNRWSVLPCLGYLNDISEQEVLHRIQVYNFYEFIYLFDEFPLCCQHNRRLNGTQFGRIGNSADGANHSGPCEYDNEIVFNSAQRQKNNRRDHPTCSFRVFYYDQFLCKNAQMVPQLAKNCISINRSTGENFHFYKNSNVYTTIRDTYHVFHDPNNTYVLTNKCFEYLYFFCFNCDTYYDLNIVLCNLLYNHMNGLKNSDPVWEFTKMYPFVQKYKKTYDVRIKRQRVKQTDIYFICPNCILNNVYNIMEHLFFFYYFCDIVNAHNHDFLIYNEYVKNIFHVDLPFFCLYNVPKEKALLNAQKKKMPIVVQRGKNLPAHKGSKKKKNSLVCANGKRKSNRNGEVFPIERGGKHKIGNPMDSGNNTSTTVSTASSNTIGSDRSAVRVQGRAHVHAQAKAQELIATASHSPPLRDRHGEVAKGGSQKGQRISRTGMANREKEQLGGETTKMEYVKEEANEAENPSHPLEGSRVKGEVSPTQGCGQILQEEAKTNKRRSDRKRKKKKEDDDELFDEACLSYESEEEDTFEDYLDGHTDEDIVEENQILIDEVYSGDSDFCKEEQTSGRKRRKKTGKKVKPLKRESVKGKKSATREKATTAAGGTHSVGSIPGSGNSIAAVMKKEEELKTLVHDVRRTCNEGNATNRSISKYKKVIDKIKHALDKEVTTNAGTTTGKTTGTVTDTKELSERIVKGVIQNFSDKMEIKMKLFSICSNLMRKDNAELRKKILNGIIHATDLAHMDSSDLAPISLKNKRMEHERKYFYENIYLRENILDLKNSKKVEEEEVFHHPSVILEQKEQQPQQQQQLQQGNASIGQDSEVNGEGLIHPCEGKRGSFSNQSDELDTLKHGDNNGEEKNAIPPSSSNGNLSDCKIRRKGSSGNEDQEKEMGGMIPPMEKYSFEFTYQNLKGMYEHMPKYASAPIMTFLDNSYNRVVAIMDASKNEQL